MEEKKIRKEVKLNLRSDGISETVTSFISK